MKVKINKFDKTKLKSVVVTEQVNEKVCYDRMGNPIFSYPVSCEYHLEGNDRWSYNWFGTKGKFYKLNKVREQSNGKNTA